jgi:hypothetical protein
MRAGWREWKRDAAIRHAYPSSGETTMELENDLNEPGPRVPGARDSAAGAADASDGEMRGHPAVVLGILVVVLAALLAYFGLRLIPR